MHFHLPYFALRQSKAPLKDRRGLRGHGILPTGSLSLNMPEYLYEAQTSLLITGTNEWLWTAYCCTETYFGSENTKQYYLENGLDAPSGGDRPTSIPVWNPREYFLSILCRRFKQVTKEWINLVETLEKRLGAQVSTKPVCSLSSRAYIPIRKPVYLKDNRVKQASLTTPFSPERGNTRPLLISFAFSSTV